jgi:hypothetical protein
LAPFLRIRGGTTKLEGNSHHLHTLAPKEESEFWFPDERECLKDIVFLAPLLVPELPPRLKYRRSVTFIVSLPIAVFYSLRL